MLGTRGRDARRLLHRARSHARAIPNDYRQRHPIVTEGSAAHRRAVHRQPARQADGTQRADVLAFAQAWRREATGGVLIDVPTGTPNAARLPQAALQEVRSILAGAGVPPEAVATRPHTHQRSAQARDACAPLSEGEADVGPCGLWPYDLGPTYRPRALREPAILQSRLRQPAQLAAMVDNPSDLVQPRARSRPTPAAAPPFSTSITAAKASATIYPDAEKGRISERRPMITNAPHNAYASAADADEHIAPAPRVSVQAFCETVETAAAVQAAGEDRRLGKAHLKIQMGGITAAVEAYSGSSTPNVIVIETESRGDDILTGLDQLAEVCDAGTRVVVIGRQNDVLLYRELTRRGVSDYLIAPVGTIDVVRAICGLFSAPDAKPVGRHDRGRRRQRRRRRVHGRAQHRLGDRPRPDARHSGRRSRPRLRDRRSRLQPGSSAGHRRCGVFSRPHRHQFRRPPALEMHRPSEPAGGAGDARSGL